MHGPALTPKEIAGSIERDLSTLIAYGLDADQAVNIVAMRLERPAWKVREMLVRYGSGVVQ